jgi:hypothetical protein
MSHIKILLILIFELFVLQNIYTDDSSFDYRQREQIKELREKIINNSELLELYDSFIDVLNSLKASMEADKLFMDDNKALIKLRDEIQKYDISTSDMTKLNMLYYLLHVDSWLDFFYIGNWRRGINKNYIMLYVLHRYDDYGFNNCLNDTEREQIAKEIFWKPPLSVLYHVGISCGGSIVRDDIKETLFDNFPYLFDYFNNKPFWNNSSYTDYEYETTIASYYSNDRGLPKRFYQPPFANILTKTLLYDFLVYDLYLSSDFHEDLTIYCTEGFKDSATKARDLVGKTIPIVLEDISEPWGEDQLHIGARYTKAKTIELFNKYYSKNWIERE